ncbi:MAG: DUF116 domain-containing protein [Candidatus Eisenbacteria bacterium]|nr:DUF116 domain-containing protein [Candidatus Eisenbacteria bacterium]
MDPANKHPDSGGAARDAAAPRRILGEAWRDWDPARELAGGDSRAAPVLFLSLATLLTALAIGAYLLLLWLAAPRLASFGVDGVLLRAWRWGGAGLLLLPALLLWGLPIGIRYPRRVAAALLFFLVFVWNGAEGVARTLRISRDRLGHAFVRVANPLALQAHPRAGGAILILAPRCLQAGMLRGLRALASEAGARLVVVGGGSQALAAIEEAAPRAVLAVACERDLVAGMREVAPHLAVLGLANRRPEGPCRNSEIDLDEARVLLRQLGRRGA